MLSKRFWIGVCVGMFMGTLGLTHAQAQDKVDLLQAEGAPANVASQLDKQLRVLLGKQSQVKLLGNPLSPMMARLTLGCASDTPACMQSLAKMRSARYLYHLRVLPAGGPMVLAMLRKIDGATGQTVKAASHTFMTKDVNAAAASLASKIGFAVAAPAPRPAAPAPRPAAPAPRPAAPAPRPAAPAPRPAAPAPRPVIPPAPEDPRPRPRPVAPRVEPRPAPRPMPRIAPEPARPAVPAPAPRMTFKPIKIRRPAPPAPRVEPQPAPRAVAKTPTPRPEPRRLAPPVRRATKKVAQANAGTIGKTQTPPGKPLWKKPVFWAWVSVGVAAASAGVAISFGALANAKQGQIDQALKESQTGQALSYRNDIQPLEREGQTNATVSNVGLAVSLVGVAAAATLFIVAYTSKPAKPQPKAMVPPPVPPGKKVNLSGSSSSFTVFQLKE